MRSESSYSPSVPVSVYRELAAELQATKAMVDSLSVQNKHLTSQNHLLRQNVHQMVQLALQLGHHAGVAHPAEVEMSFSTPPLDLQPHPHTQQQQPMAVDSVQHGQQEDPYQMAVPQRPQAASGLSKVFTEQSGENRRYSMESANSGSLSTLWLIVSIAIIILTAFGAGFLIMRPLISDR